MESQASKPKSTPKYQQTERFFKSVFDVGTAYHRVRATDTLGVWVEHDTKEVKGLTFETLVNEKSLSEVVDYFGYTKKTEITKKEFTAILKLVKTIF